MSYGILLLCRNGYLGASGQKIGPHHLLRRPRFRIRQMYFHYRVTFTGYIWCFCATTSCDLVTKNDLLTLRVFHVQCLSCPTHQFWLPYNSRFSITFPLSGTVSAHARCHVTYNWGAKLIHIFNFFCPNLPIHFVTFRALQRRLSRVIGKNSVYPRLQSLLCMRGITWPVHRGSHTTKRNNFFVPELSIHYTAFTGLRWQLSIVFIGASPC